MTYIKSGSQNKSHVIYRSQDKNLKTNNMQRNLSTSTTATMDLPALAGSTR